jgi:2-hydroxychromene-2-carboxylate isomerase
MSGMVSMAADHIDFWFTMGSTYSYLSVMRLVEVERSSSIRFRWRPFHLLVILQEMKHVPFADKPTKSAYMWRDIERRAAMYGIPASLPAPYPAKQSIMANVVASAGMRQGWGVDFVRMRFPDRLIRQTTPTRGRRDETRETDLQREASEIDCYFTETGATVVPGRHM